MDRIHIGLIGFGTVGTGLVRILQENAQILEERLGLSIVLKRIADLDTVKDRGVKVDRALLTPKVDDILEDPEIAVVAELIGGLAPARTFILKAIAKGKHVVTANKALLAVHGAEIFRAAEEVLRQRRRNVFGFRQFRRLRRIGNHRRRRRHLLSRQLSHSCRDGGLPREDVQPAVKDNFLRLTINKHDPPRRLLSGRVYYLCYPLIARTLSLAPCGLSRTRAGVLFVRSNSRLRGDCFTA